MSKRHTVNAKLELSSVGENIKVILYNMWQNPKISKSVECILWKVVVSIPELKAICKRRRKHV